MASGRQITIDEFIKKSNIKHNWKYDYSKVIYTKAEVDTILKNKNITFEKQKRFSWLGRQSLDFYLPDYNIRIECQGEQHYKPVDFAGKGKKWAIDNLKTTQKRDRLKKELCENNGVKILYYSKYNKNINI